VQLTTRRFGPEMEILMSRICASGRLNLIELTAKRGGCSCPLRGVALGIINARKRQQQDADLFDPGLLADKVRNILIVLAANVFEEVRVGQEHRVLIHTPGLGVGLRIVDG
jgi:hypothetical protein